MCGAHRRHWQAAVIGIADPVKCRVLEIEWRTDNTKSIDGFIRSADDDAARNQVNSVARQMK